MRRSAGVLDYDGPVIPLRRPKTDIDAVVRQRSDKVLGGPVGSDGRVLRR